MTWASLLLRFGLPLLLGFAGGYVFSDWLSEDDRVDAATMRADKALIAQASQYQREINERDAENGRRLVVKALERLDRARAAREVRYEIRDRIVEKIPADLLCLDADALRVLERADRAAAIGLADSLDTAPIVGGPGPPAAPGAGLSAQAAARRFLEDRDAYDRAREQINAFKQWAEAHDGKAGRLKIGEPDGQ